MVGNNHYWYFSRGENNKMKKILTSLRAYVREDRHQGKTKFCATCGDPATVEALFDVGDGVTLIEKYCDLCAKKVRQLPT